ncbi:MAG: T9SS type A sorting domain-containing protein, partial [Bacteroidaceae bacterium]|nr:T9SS type A sorting domain-containing protein [Bacteroidaceae bacterium]
PSSTAALNQSIECNSGLVAGDTMKTALDSIRLIYYDIAPDDKTRWITDTIAFPFRLYNAPSRPAKLVKKGNYTSHFYIALMDESKFGNENVDEILKQRKYCFEYGNGQTEPKSYGKKTCADSTGYPQARWFDYTDQDDSNPWVQTYWDYLAIDEYPAHTSISEKRYAVSSRGDDDGTTAITSADISDSNDHLGSVLRIFDMNGRRLNSNDLNGLPSGIYIVETVKDGQMTRNKVIVN